MSETPSNLASACAIVAPPFRNDFAAPLTFLPFQTPGECADQCARLLEDHDRLHSFRAASAEYYRQYGRPAAQMLSCLNAAFDESAGIPALIMALPS